MADDVEEFSGVAPPRTEVDVDVDGADVVVTAQRAFGPTPAPRAPRSTFATAELAAAAVQERFGVSLQGSWSLEELSRVHETFMQLGPKEREAVRGLELRREAGAPSHVGDAAGLFRRGDEVDSRGRRVGGASITFYNGAFPSSDNSAVDRQTTMSVVLHEVGHALEGHALGHLLAERQAGAVVAREVDRFEERLGPQHTRALRAVRAFDDDVVVAPIVSAIKAWSSAHAVIGDASAPLAERRAALVELQQAQAEATALVAALPAGHPARRAATTLMKLNADVTSRQPAYLDAVQRRQDAEAAILDGGAQLDDPDTEQDDTLGALEREFQAMGVATTTYGSTSPVENFAEAYMLYKLEPWTLKQQSAAAWAFFRKHFPI